MDKRVVKLPDSADDVWWGPINIAITDDVFHINRERAIDYLNTRPRLYCIDAFAGWDADSQVRVRVICARPYRALFMHIMLIRPTPASWPISASPTSSSSTPANSQPTCAPRA